VGRGNRHIKLELLDGTVTTPVQGIAFSQKDHFARLKEGLPVDICYSIEQNKPRDPDIHPVDGKRISAYSPDKRSPMPSGLFHTILQEYWGYDSFGPCRRRSCSRYGRGRDTLGLMPTGGGKSLTFQVPVMGMEGICLVVTP